MTSGPLWFPFYIDDWRRDTMRLSLVEKSAYLNMLLEYYATGGLPDDDERLARIAGVSGDEWRGIRRTLQGFFLPGGWTHKRVEIELEHVRKRSEDGKRAAAARWKNDSRKPLKEKTSMRPHIRPHMRGDMLTTVTKNIDSSLRSESIEAQAPKNNLTARENLEKVLSADMADAVIDHRKKLRKPLSAYAAELLARKFVAAGDPEAAARVMIERGWQGFEVEWMARGNGSAGNGRRDVSSNSTSAAADRLLAEWFGAGANESQDGAGTSPPDGPKLPPGRRG